MSIRDEARERPTIALAREIASWDQDNPGTGRIPHWAVNLAAHLIDKGYEQADREPSDAEEVARLRLERLEAVEDFITRHYLDTQMGERVLAIVNGIEEVSRADAS